MPPPSRNSGTFPHLNLPQQVAAHAMRAPREDVHRVKGKNISPLPTYYVYTFNII